MVYKLHNKELTGKTTEKNGWNEEADDKKKKLKRSFLCFSSRSKEGCEKLYLKGLESGGRWPEDSQCSSKPFQIPFPGSLD